MRHVLTGVACLLAITQASAQTGDGTGKAATAPVERLTIGDEAPPLDLAHWISDANGERPPFPRFEPGHVYVLGFWGTW